MRKHAHRLLLAREESTYMPYGLTEAIVEDLGARLILAMDPLTVQKRDAVSGIFVGVDEEIDEGELVYTMQDLSLANWELKEGSASEGPTWNESGVAARSLVFSGDRLKCFESNNNAFRFLHDNTVDFSLQLGLGFTFPASGVSQFILATRGFGTTPGMWVNIKNTGGVITLGYGIHNGTDYDKLDLDISSLDEDTLYWVRLTHVQDPVTPVTTLSIDGTELVEVDTLTKWSTNAQDDNLTLGNDADGTAATRWDGELVGVNVNKGFALTTAEFDKYKTYFEGRAAA
jgi:hypothetical protein